MQFKQTLVRLFFLLSPFNVFPQATTYLPKDARENVLLERLEIKVLRRTRFWIFQKRNLLAENSLLPITERYVTSIRFIYKTAWIV